MTSQIKKADIWLFFEQHGDSKYKCLVTDLESEKLCSKIVIKSCIIGHMRRFHTILYNELNGIKISSEQVQNHKVLKENILLKYYNPVQDGFKCRRCKAVMFSSMNVIGLWHHLRCKHHDVYVGLKAKIKARKLKLKPKEKTCKADRDLKLLSLSKFFCKMSDASNMHKCLVQNSVTKQECGTSLHPNSRRRHLMFFHTHVFREWNFNQESSAVVLESKQDVLESEQVVLESEKVVLKPDVLESEQDVLESEQVVLEKVVLKQDLLESKQDVLESEQVVLTSEQVVLKQDVLESVQVVLESKQDVLESEQVVLESEQVVLKQDVLESEQVVLESGQGVLESEQVVLESKQDVLKCKPTNTVKTVCLPTSCVFCNLNKVNEKLYGKLQTYNGVSLHYFCSLFASGLKQRGDCDSDPLWGFRVADIKQEVKRTRKLRCLYCGNMGASIGCCFRKCRVTFHYPCGVVNHAVNQFYNTFRSFCGKHRIQQKMPAVCCAVECKSCMICLNDLEIEGVSPSVMILPCCSGARLHRTCIQRMAISAGKHHFKCPLCNNVEVFLEKMQYCGIYVPDQDAAWELERNAYHDLLSRHKECDARHCICPRGRNYCNTNRWNIILCHYCGSHGTHLSCGKLSTSQTWACPTCSSTLRLNSAARRGRGARGHRGSRNTSVRQLRSNAAVSGTSCIVRNASKSPVDVVGSRRGRTTKYITSKSLKRVIIEKSENSAADGSRSSTKHSALKFFHPNTSAVNFASAGSSRARSESSTSSNETLLVFNSEASDEEHLHASRNEPLLRTRGKRSTNVRGSRASCVVSSRETLSSKLIESDEEKLNKVPFVSLPRLPCNLVEVRQLNPDDEMKWSYDSESSAEHPIDVDLCSSPDSSPVVKSRGARWIPGTDGKEPVIAVAGCSKTQEDSSLPCCARHRQYRKSDKDAKMTAACDSMKRSSRLAATGRLEVVGPASELPLSFSGGSLLESVRASADEVYEISDSDSSSSVKSFINLASQEDDDEDDVVWVAENSRLTQPQAPCDVIDIASSTNMHLRQINEPAGMQFLPTQNQGVYGGVGFLGGVSSFQFAQNRNVIPNDISYWLAMANSMATAGNPAMAYLNPHQNFNPRQ